MPKILLTYNDIKFVNKVMKECTEQNRSITHTTVPSYHPQANPVERINRVLKNDTCRGGHHRDYHHLIFDRTFT